MVESRSDTSPEWSLQEPLCGKRNRKYDRALVDEDFLGYSGPANPPYTVPDCLPAECKLRDDIFIFLLTHPHISLLASLLAFSVWILRVHF